MRLTKFIYIPIVFLLLAPLGAHSLAAGLPPLKGGISVKLRAVPIPSSPPSTPAQAISKIGVRFGAQIVAFSPTYPVNKAKLQSALSAKDLSSALSLLSDAMDGHVEDAGNNLYAIVPNFTSDTAAAPLDPQIRAAVRSSCPIAWILYDIPAALRPDAIAPSAISLKTLGASILDDIHLLSFGGKSISESLFDGHAGGERTLSIRPELMVSLCYGYSTLASFDEWSQKDAGESTRWDLYTSLDSARAAWKAPSPAPGFQPIELSDATIAITQSTISGSDLSKVGDAVGAEFIIDQKAASLKAIVTPGNFASSDFLQAVREALRLRIYQADSEAGSEPVFAVAAPAEKSNQELIHNLVDRQIMTTWSAMIEAIVSRGGSFSGPFPLGGFEEFSTIPYSSLTDAQRSVVDKALLLLPEALSATEKERLYITLRPALIADCKADQAPTADIEEISTLYSDLDPKAEKKAP